MVARSALIACMGLLALSLAGSASCASPRTPAQPVVAASECAAAVPEATLRRGAYPQQSFRRLADNAARETAQIARHVRLTIDYAGCADVSSRTITLRIDDPKRGRHDALVWAAFLADTLQRLETAQEKRWFEPGLTRFLHDMTTRRLQIGRVERCFDGSKPDVEGCAFEAGGGYRFDVKNTSTVTTIVAESYQWL